MSAATAASPPAVVAHGERRPLRRDKWLARGAWTVVALCCIQILFFAFGRDQAIYAVVGDAVLGGDMPYRDAWDFKPPGIFLVYAAAQALFGRAMSSIRILEVIGLIGMVFAFRRFARNSFGSTLPGLLGGACALLIHTELEFWHTAQPEAFGGMLTAFALVATTGSFGHPASALRRRLSAWTLVGALFGAAFLMKPPLGGGAPVCALYLAWGEFRHSRRPLTAVLPVLVVGVASVVPIVLCAAWFAVRGAWPALRWTLFEFTPGYTALGWHGTPLGLFEYGLEEALISFSHAVPAGILLAVLLPRRSERERSAIALVMSVVLVHVAGIALQAKFFGYHYSATLPLLALVAGLGLTKAWQYTSRVPVAGALLWVAVLGVLVWSRTATRHVPGTCWERSWDRLSFLLRRSPSREELDASLYMAADYDLDNDRRAANAVRDLTSSGDAIFVWGFEPYLYWASGRRRASRYLYDVPQRTAWEQGVARTGLLADLAKTPPEALIVQHNDTFRFVTGDDLDSSRALGTFPALAALLDRDYGLAVTVDDLDIYLRR
ncbi:MAG TPA: glycosyltransferase family 39 protein [Polyangiaceae bacterium]